jgi:hypothetical protein
VVLWYCGVKEGEEEVEVCRLEKDGRKDSINEPP